MKVRYVFFLVLMGLSVRLGAQNLVPNGSFELLDSCPNGSGCGGLIELATPWFEPINCTSDLLNGCANDLCSVPSGDVYPYDGIGMAGLLFRGGAGNETREYVSVKLNQPLIPDSAYQFSIRLHLTAQNATSVGSVGVLFSEDSMTNYGLNHSLYNIQPQLQRNPDSIMSTFGVWYEWGDTLVAIGGERFLMIGNFLSDSETPFTQPSFNPGSSYFIDDVRLMKIAQPNSIRELDLPFLVYPNPTKDILTLESGKRLKEIVLYDLRGRMVLPSLTSPNPSLRQAQGRHLQGGEIRVDVSALPTGIYFLRVTDENGNTLSRKVVVE